MRKTMILIGIVALLLVPAAVLAQDDIAQVIELVFTDGGSKIGITDTFESVASVAVEIDGIQYLMKVPVTIDIDAMVPITSSIVTANSAARVGRFAFEIIDVNESTDEIEMIIPGILGDTEQKFEPMLDGNKIVVVEYEITNLGDEEEGGYSFEIDGVDDTGRLFRELRNDCERTNPGETGYCVIAFDVESGVDIVGLDLTARDHKQLPIP